MNYINERDHAKINRDDRFALLSDCVLLPPYNRLFRYFQRNMSALTTTTTNNNNNQQTEKKTHTPKKR
jgi:hypothetical protein